MKKLKELDLSLELDKKMYKKKIKMLQYEILNAQQFLFNNKIGLIIVFEGMDAAGKGGAIKRLTERVDPRGLLVTPISAPQPHEKRHHYMHRFWRKLPQHGQIAIFDRSWYGRVLVERIEGFATEKDWKRAYGEINDFEKQLTDEDYIMIKFWIHIDEDEQLKRFNERAHDPYKAWKLTDEDWRNREKFGLYCEAADEMFAKTDTENAPWCLIPGNNKLYARVQVLKEVMAHIEKEVARRGLHITNVLEKQQEEIEAAEHEEVATTGEAVVAQAKKNKVKKKKSK
ncbi:polyphosphate kinase [Solibacillus sp. MA9]|uniref:Polyphosphate kinase n=1 Tax=Solibacillus palustris TaxID=2908203 RepID=A0ABS9UG40_9BACL|nr:polyphosphate kinase [Solibacillus sp. MA9]MCH7323218.1 polyphosphate kinase [Solibacillus sp. MA9]